MCLTALALHTGCSQAEQHSPGKDMATEPPSDMTAERDAQADTQADLAGDDAGHPERDQGHDLSTIDMSATDMTQDMAEGFTLPQVKLISSGTLMLLERSFPYKLLELKCGEQAPTYVQWIEPDAAAERPYPVVAMTQPYAGIDWTGQEVDAKWAARGVGLHPDDSEPGYIQGSGAVIAYEPLTPEQGGQQAVVHLLNGLGVLHMFGRFYAGGSVLNDIEDMTCGLSYLATLPEADTARIGTFGGSWGGFEAVYGALYAPKEVAPAVGVALTPLTDFSQEWTYVDGAEADPRPLVAQQFTQFFEPYKRRIRQTTGGDPSMGDFSAITHQGLLKRANQTRFLAIHDSDDALVPFTMGESFAQDFGERVEPVWVLSQEPLDLERSGLSHGVRMNELYVTLITLSSIYLHTALIPESKPLIIVYERANFKQLLRYAYEQKQRGQGTQQLAKRLIELSASRVTMFDLASNQFTPGAQEIASLVNEVFGTSYDAMNVAAALSMTGL